MSSLTPLAARMRPADLDEYVGQGHLLAPGAPLRLAVDAGRPVSLLLWGPPGSGKTTLAQLLAAAFRAEFVPMSAVSSGLPELREVLALARTRRANNQATVVFLDEIHRFDKRQQDALLPAVEDGTISLIGATTEIPWKMLNAALLSRMRIFRVEPLSIEQLQQIALNAIDDSRGLGGVVSLDDDAMRALVGFGGGDARRMLSLLDVAADAALLERPSANPDRPAPIKASDIARAAGGPALDFDESSTQSALIKSIRGSDPDAALYWLATLLNAGVDPRVVARRLLISAGEDIGPAEPTAMPVAAAALTAAEGVGMPEVQYPLANAVVLLATAPKSDRAGAGYFAALELINETGTKPVPNHLRAMAKTYRNPHHGPDEAADQHYLPRSLVGRAFYEPTDRGVEGERAADVQRRREARKTAKPLTRITPTT